MQTLNMKKLAAVAVATAINAGLLLAAGPASKALRLPDRVLPWVLLGIILTWYVVFTVLLFLASRSEAPGRRRGFRLLGESTIAMIIFCAVLCYPIAHLH